MNSDDFGKFSNALGVLCELFTKELSPLAIQTYFRVMQKFSIQEVEEAISNAIITCKYFPKPAELIERITGGSQKIMDQAELQSLEVIKQINSIGSYRSPKFNDPVTSYLMRYRFPWGSICGMNEKDKSFFVKDFKEAYVTCHRNRHKLEIDSKGRTREIEHDSNG
jgi:hypothetical protein